MNIKNRLKAIELQKLKDIKAEIGLYVSWLDTLTPEQICEEKSKLIASIDGELKLPGFCEWVSQTPEFEEKFPFDYDGLCFAEMVRRFQKL